MVSSKYLLLSMFVLLVVPEFAAGQGNLAFLDDYDIEGTVLDGVLWVNGDLQIGIDPGSDLSIPSSAIEGECYRPDGDAGTFLTHCWFVNSQKRTQCDDHSGLISCSNPSTTCSLDLVGDYRSGIIDESQTNLQVHRARYFADCQDTLISQWTTEGDTFLIMDQKRSVCTNSTHYEYQGRYGGSNWATYVGPLSCEGICQDAQTQVISDRNSQFTPPCASCDGGTIRTIVSVDGGAAIGYPVLLNNNPAGETSGIGTLDIRPGKVSCDANQNITVLCADGVETCDSKVTQIDVIGDEDTLQFDCTLQCGSKRDLTIAEVVVEGKTVTVSVASQDVTQSGIVVNISRGNDLKFIAESMPAVVNVAAGEVTSASVTFDELGDGDVLRIWLDNTNVVPDEDNTNNFMQRQAFRQVKVFLITPFSSSVGGLEHVVTGYVESVATLVPESQAEIVLRVSPKTGVSPEKFVVDGKEIQKPFGARIRKTPIPGTARTLVEIEGLGFEGMIAGLKYVIDRRAFFFSQGVSHSYITDTDPLGIRVFEQLNSPEANQKKQSNSGLQQLVGSILYDEQQNIDVKPVKTTDDTSYGQETLLRVKHVNNDLSNDYKEAFGISRTPVVFSGGIFSNLETWEDNGKGLAAQMARKGWDVWEIEMTGGPGTDCKGQDVDTCPNYTYQDLVDHYWPTSIAGVMAYSNENKIHYVGHSNGCRAALSSLNDYSSSGKNNAGFYLDEDTGNFTLVDLPALPVDKFFGVACPGILNGETSFTLATRQNIVDSSELIGRRVLNDIDEAHVTMRDFALPASSHLRLDLKNPIASSAGTGLLTLAAVFSDNTFVRGDTISKNLLDTYITLAENELSTIDLSGVSVSKVVLINGKPSDLIVPFEDQAAINESLEIQNVRAKSIGNATIPGFNDHSSIRKRNIVEEIVKGELQ